MPNYLFIIIFIISGFLVFLQNRLKYQSHFYENLSIKQLYSESIGIVNSILKQQKEISNYRFSNFKNHNDFNETLLDLKKKLKTNNPEAIEILNTYFKTSGNFEQLADNNKWIPEYNKLHQRFQLIYGVLINM